MAEMLHFKGDGIDRQAELLVNVWPPSDQTPEGKVEMYTTRGQSVFFTLQGFLNMFQKVEVAAGVVFEKVHIPRKESA